MPYWIFFISSSDFFFSAVRMAFTMSRSKSVCGLMYFSAIMLHLLFNQQIYGILDDYPTVMPVFLLLNVLLPAIPDIPSVPYIYHTPCKLVNFVVESTVWTGIKYRWNIGIMCFVCRSFPPTIIISYTIRIFYCSNILSN